jgi:hypothetical protein
VVAVGQGPALVLQESRCAPSVPKKCRTGQVPMTLSQVSAYPPLTLLCPFLNRVSQVRILSGHHHSPDKTRLDQDKHQSKRILCSAAVCRHQAPSATVRETIAKRRTGLGTPVDRLLWPRRAASTLVVPNPDPRSDRPSRQTDWGGRRAVPCRCRLVRWCAEGRGAFPQPDHM